jgi:hypothetical protein
VARRDVTKAPGDGHKVSGRPSRDRAAFATLGHTRLGAPTGGGRLRRGRRLFLPSFLGTRQEVH